MTNKNKGANHSLHQLKKLYPTIPNESLIHWHDFVRCNPEMKTAHKIYQTSYFIGDTPDSSEKGLNLIKSGFKTATSELLLYFTVNHEELPTINKICIVRSLATSSICIVQTTKVEIVPFGLITEEFVQAYGETSPQLDQWYKVFTPYYEKSCESLGQKLERHTPLVTEWFKVLYSSE